MYSCTLSTLRKQKPGNANTQLSDFLVLASEPTASEYMPGKHLGLHYQNRYLARRRLRRNIQRLRRDQVR